MEMRPELIFKTGKIGVCGVRVLESMKNLTVHIDLLPLLPSTRGRKIHGSAAAALCISHDQRPKETREELRNQQEPLRILNNIRRGTWMIPPRRHSPRQSGNNRARTKRRRSKAISTGSWKCTMASLPLGSL